MRRKSSTEILGKLPPLKVISILLCSVPTFSPQTLELKALLDIPVQPSHFTEEEAGPERGLGLSTLTNLAGGRGGLEPLSSDAKSTDLSAWAHCFLRHDLGQPLPLLALLPLGPYNYWADSSVRAQMTQTWGLGGGRAGWCRSGWLLTGGSDTLRWGIGEGQWHWASRIRPGAA